MFFLGPTAFLMFHFMCFKPEVKNPLSRCPLALKSLSGPWQMAFYSQGCLVPFIWGGKIRSCPACCLCCSGKEMCWCLTQSQGLQHRPAAPDNCFVDWVSFNRTISSVVNSSLLIICCHTCRWKDYSHFWPTNGEIGFSATLQWVPVAVNTPLLPDRSLYS